MNRFLNIIIFLFFSLSAFSQNLLDNQWQFRTGDSLVWKNPAYKSSGWNSIKSGVVWENQGFKDYDGFAWYRKTIVIPHELKEEVMKNGGMTLNLGAFDDADQAFFNGKPVGESGSMPPNHYSAYDKIRKYDILAKDILWDKENVIAVRVFDIGGDGGMTGPDVSLKVGGLGSNLKMKAQFPAENHIFSSNENVTFDFTISNATDCVFNGMIKYYLISDFKDTISTNVEKLKLTANQSKKISYKEMN